MPPRAKPTQQDLPDETSVHGPTSLGDPVPESQEDASHTQPAFLTSALVDMETKFQASLKLQEHKLHEHFSRMEDKLLASISSLSLKASSSPTGVTPVVDPPLRASAAPSDGSQAFKPNRLKPNDLPKFYGHPDDQCDIDDWIEQVQAIFEYSDVSETQLLSTLPMILKDSALEWFTSLGQQRLTFKTWPQWQDALRNAFRPPNFMERIHLQLSRRLLKDDEPFSVYFQSKVKLINKRYGDNISESIKIEEVISGIPTYMHPLVRTSLYASPTQTLQTLRRTLLELEEGLRAQMPQHQEIDGPQELYQPEIDAQVSSNHVYPARKRHVPRVSNSQDTSSNPQPYIVHSDGRQSQLVCYRCGTPGHYANNCPGRSTDGSTQ